MKFFYLPKPRKRSILNGQDKKFHRIYNRRHHKPKEVQRLVTMVVGLYLLWIAVKVGFIIPLSLQNPSALDAMYYLQDRNITLPGSTYAGHTYTQSRFNIYIVINSYGKTEVNGELLPNTGRTDFMESILRAHPNGIPTFIVDKDTPMEFVSKMVHHVRQAGFQKVKFSTSRKESN